MRLLNVDKEEGFLLEQRRATLTEPGQRKWTTDIPARNIVSIQSSLQSRLIIEKAVRIEALIANEVVSSATIIF